MKVIGLMECKNETSLFNKVISNNEATKRIIHEKHERHEKKPVFVRVFRVFRGLYFFLRVRFLMGCSFLGIT